MTADQAGAFRVTGLARRHYNDDHEAYRHSVREFLRRSALPHVQQYASDKGLPRKFWLDAGRQGLLGLEVPEKYGGVEARDYRFNAVLLEELSSVNASLSSCVSIQADIVAPYLVRLTTEQQRERWLPRLVSGDLVGAIAMTEPGGGSDLAGLKTTATPVADGWVINGSKTFITNGYSADLVITAVRTSPEKKARGITLFAVASNAPGFSRGRKLDKVGNDESDTAELYFHDVHVTQEDMVGGLDNGFVHLMENLPQERLGCAISNLAHARQILMETLDYAKSRKAFGQAIGSFQHNKFLLAELFTKAEVTQSFVDGCVMAHAQGGLTAVTAAMAKWWTSQVQNEILDHCVQVYGGYGYMNEYRVARAWRDARVTKIWAGTNEIMKEIIGRDLGL